jgi:hypothetical protein
MNSPAAWLRGSLVPLMLGMALAPACLDDLGFERGEGDFCDLETPCATGLYCVLGSNACAPRVADAASCQSDAACLSGFCEAGLCCQTNCPGPCRACNVSSNAGQCVAVLEGSDPFDGCPGTTSCGPSAQCQASPVWSAAWGDQSDQRTSATAIGPGGEVVVVGSFTGTIDFETGPLQTSGERDLFVAKLSAGGELLWARAIGGAGEQVAEDVVVDGQGNVVLAGWFSVEADIAEGVLLTSGGKRDGLVLRLDADGELDWAKAVTGPDDQQLLSLDLTNTGTVVLGGATQGATSVDGCNVAADDGSSDALLVTVDEMGACIEARRFGSPNRPQSVTSLAADASALVVGITGRGSVDFGSGPLAAGTADLAVWLGAFGLDGNPVWSVLLDDEGDERVAAVAPDGSGGAWIAGTTTVAPTANRALVSEDGDLSVDDDVFVAHIGSDGVEQLRRVFMAPYAQTAEALAVTSGSEVVVVGAFELAVNFGNGTIDAAGGMDAFVAKLDANGDAIWSLPIGSRMDERATGVALAASDQISVSLDFQDRVVLGGVIHQPQGGDDILIARLNP